MRSAAAVLAFTMAFGIFCGAGAQDEDIVIASPGPAGELRGGLDQRLEIFRSMVDRDDEGGPELMRFRPGPAFLLRHREALGLTREQVDKLKTIRINLVRQTGALRTDLRVGEIELRDMLDDIDKLDLTGAEAKIRALGELRSSLKIAGIKAQVEALSVLSVEQREQAKGLQQQRHRRPRVLPGPGFGAHSGFGPGPDCFPGRPDAMDKK